MSVNHGKNKKETIAIDGMGGSGKSDLVKNILNSGFFKKSVGVFNSGNYARGIAYNLMQSGITPDDLQFKEAALQAMDQIDFTVDKPEYATTEVEKFIPAVTAIKEIKQGFADKLPHIIDSFKTDIVIVVGRVIGSLYPDAIVKLYLETSPDICAHRRAYERSLKGEDYAHVLAEQKKRNQADKANWNQKRPEDTIVVNTNHSTAKDVMWKTLYHLNKVF